MKRQSLFGLQHNVLQGRTFNSGLPCDAQMCLTAGSLNRHNHLGVDAASQESESGFIHSWDHVAVQQWLQQQVGLVSDQRLPLGEVAQHKALPLIELPLERSLQDVVVGHLILREAQAGLWQLPHHGCKGHTVSQCTFLLGHPALSAVHNVCTSLRVAAPQPWQLTCSHARTSAESAGSQFWVSAAPQQRTCTYAYR